MPGGPGDQPLTVLPGVGPATAARWASVGVHTLSDLVLRFPRGYQDRRDETPIGGLRPGDLAVLAGQVVAARQGKRRGRQPGALSLRVQDATGAITATFFAPPPYLADRLPVGAWVRMVGRCGAGAPLTLAHPEWELAEEGSPADGAIVPIHGVVDGISSRAQRKLVAAALDLLPPDPGHLPAALRDAHGLPRRDEALRIVHFPGPDAELDALRAGRHRAHEALLLEDLFVLQVALLRRRVRRSEQGAAADLLPRARMGGPRAAATLRARARARVPFALSPSQEQALAAIDADLAVPGRPMQRLVHGDVGAGKTVLALLAATQVLDRGGQVAVLAPTELLARQWHEQASALFAPLGVEVALLLGSLGGAERRAAEARVAQGQALFVVGTHALLAASTRIPRLGLVIVDEQQRFGVFQRARLGDDGPQPHLLCLSATPIPRTLARTVFGDLDLTVLSARAGAAGRRTTILPSARRAEAYGALRSAAERGERGFVVCPVIEGGAGDPLRSVLGTAEDLANGPLEGIPLGVVHGAMDGAARDAALTALRSGRLTVLVGTTVLELGLDVPEASVMVVENAERFGLAQLHQLRGRVGRAGIPGVCVLLTPDPEAAPRLTVLTQSDDGFQIADADLRERGPGDLVGARQAGRPAFRLWTSPRFVPLLEIARAAAGPVVARPDFATVPELAALRSAARAVMADAASLRAG